jgi:hypothetical protein
LQSAPEVKEWLDLLALAKQFQLCKNGIANFPVHCWKAKANIFKPFSTSGALCKFNIRQYNLF